MHCVDEEEVMGYLEKIEQASKQESRRRRRRRRRL
jgi:hypothetical protein